MILSTYIECNDDVTGNPYEASDSWSIYESDASVIIYRNDDGYGYEAFFSINV